MDETTAICTGCGKPTPRNDMFGVEPDLHCERCAAGVRERLHTRKRLVFTERAPIVTAALLAISVVVFIVTDLIYGRPSAERSIPPWVAALAQGTGIWFGEWWRHITTIFVHGGWLHLAMNGFSLWQLGRIMESGWGSARLAALVVGTGAGGAAIAWLFSAPYANVGLSGGIFGLCGFLWALAGHHPLATAIMTPRMKNWILTMSAIFLFLSFSNAVAISNAGHGGGFGLGFALGLVARRKEAWVVPAAVGLMVAAFALAHFVTIGSTSAYGTQDPRTGTKQTIEMKRSEVRARVLEGYLGRS